MKSVLNIHWKDWCWSWNSNTLVTWREELTHWKRSWCWERLKAGGEGDDRGWDGYMASPTQWAWVWVNSGNWWWTGRSGMLRFMGSQTVGYDWATELNWSKEVGDSCLKTNNNNNKKLNSLKGFSKALLKARWGRHVVGCCRLLGVGILCSCSCPHRSGHDIPINFQQDKYYSLFCSFLSLYKWMLQGQSPENGLSYII